MAVMIGCAVDWTFDEFMADARAYKATPRKGVHCRADASDREEFMVWLKNKARDFKAAWVERHEHLYATHYGWVGDAFKQELCEGLFSDFYKDTYGQRPHLPIWFYVQAVGLPTVSDVTYTFCATPVEDAEEAARDVRERLRAM